MIVLYERGFAPQCFEDGLKYAFSLPGHTFVGYDPSQTAVFDAFDSISPNLYLGSISKQPTAVTKCLREFSTKFYALEAIPAAADVVSFKAGKIINQFQTEVVYVGEYDKRIDKFINTAKFYFYLKIFQDMNQKGQRWGIKEELGLIDKQEMINIYASSRCSLAFDDPHKFYQILLSGGFPLAKKFHLPQFPYSFYFEDGEQMRKEIAYVIDKANSKTITSSKNAILEQVLRNNTYFHRVFNILNDIKKYKEATKVLEFYYDNFPI